MSGQPSCSLVVIDQINIRGVALLKMEDDPTVSENGDAPITGKLTLSADVAENLVNRVT